MPDYLVWIGYALVAVFAVVTAGHALVYKRDVRATIAWVGFILVLPLVGATLYWLFAINRIQRKAGRLRPTPAGAGGAKNFRGVNPAGRFAALARLGNAVTHFPLTAGNALEPLVDGDIAYPAMLAAIEAAERSIALTTYIFDVDGVGARFERALADAHARGVEVRVLIDAVGGHQWLRRGMVDRLQARGIPVAEFLPIPSLRRAVSFNLRNHRKLLVIDGITAFTGGMNITAEALRDLQFRVTGPVVGQLQQVFADDWHFVTGETLDDERWFPPLDEAGQALARAVPDGPDDNFDVLRLVLLGAITEARSSIAILTPYFLPDGALAAALYTAALRGVTVEIILPAVSDSPLITWASRAGLWQLLERDCRIRFSSRPFDHSKLMIVDDAWALIGSTNWDPRSLRLNFELNLECYDPAFATCMRALFDARRDAARPISKAEMDGRPMVVKLRDGAARLLTPYL